MASGTVAQDTMTAEAEISRLNDLRHYLGSLRRSMDTFAEEEAHLAKFHQKEFKNAKLHQSPFADSSNLTVLMEDVRNFHKAREEQLQKSSEGYKAIGKALDALHSEAKRVIKTLEGDADKRERQSKTELDALHKKSKELNDAIVFIKSGTEKTPKHDPCILKMSLEKTLVSSNEKKTEREKAVASMKAESALFEEKTVDSIKALLYELSKSGKSESMHALGNALKETLDKINAKEEHAAFVETSRSPLKESATLPSFDHGLYDPLSMVARKGELKRQKIMSKTSFTNCYGLLAASGFFYVYSNADQVLKSTPDYTYYLRDVVVNGGIEDEILLTEKKNKTTHVFKAASSVDAKEWIASMKAVVDLPMTSAPGSSASSLLREDTTQTDGHQTESLPSEKSEPDTPVETPATDSDPAAPSNLDEPKSSKASPASIDTQGKVKRRFTLFGKRKSTAAQGEGKNPTM